VPTGEPVIVHAWHEWSKGRKHFAGTALHAADGTLLAQADTLWIELTPEQAGSSWRHEDGQPPCPRAFSGVIVGKVFAAYPAPARKLLLAIRAMIYETAASSAGTRAASPKP
jgi:hypothetical protein